MSETKAFDVSLLKPGDEVGIERCVDGVWAARSVSHVVAIHADGLIELEGDVWYQPNGRHAAGCHATLRLAAPTDQGRHASLYEAVCEDLNDIKIAALLMDFPTLRRLKAWIDAKGWDQHDPTAPPLAPGPPATCGDSGGLRSRKIANPPNIRRLIS